MIVREIPQIKVVRADTPEAFEEAFNHLMCDMAEEGIRVRVEFDFANLTAFVHYTDEMRIMSSRADYAAATGCTGTCGECHHLQKPRSWDGRRKKFYCDADGGMQFHTMDEAACDRFYEERRSRCQK